MTNLRLRSGSPPRPRPWRAVRQGRGTTRRRLPPRSRAPVRASFGATWQTLPRPVRCLPQQVLSTHRPSFPHRATELYSPPLAWSPCARYLLATLALPVPPDKRTRASTGCRGAGASARMKLSALTRSREFGEFGAVLFFCRMLILPVFEPARVAASVAKQTRRSVGRPIRLFYFVL